MPSLTEWIGYAASVLIVTSLAMTSIVRLRIISFVGSVVFVVYGWLIGSWPVMLSNGIIAAINVVYLRRELTTRRDLGAVPMAADAPFLADFLASHADDIRQTHPSFEGAGADDFALVLMRDGMPAGVLLGRLVGTTLELDVDYVVAAYRDSRLGAWLYGEGSSLLRAHGVARVVTHPQTLAADAYLRGVGFRSSTVAGELVRQLP